MSSADRARRVLSFKGFVSVARHITDFEVNPTRLSISRDGTKDGG